MLKQARDRRGLTQGELAAKVGCHLVTICRIETGVRQPSMALLQKLAKALKVRMKDLLP